MPGEHSIVFDRFTLSKKDAVFIDGLGMGMNSGGSAAMLSRGGLESTSFGWGLAVGMVVFFYCLFFDSPDTPHRV